MRGLMMDYPLTLTHFLERANRLFPKKEVITRTASGLHRYTYADLSRRVARLAGALAGLGAVPGRFERVEAGQPFLVAVDYAHTPDALDRVLTTARKLLTGQGRLAVVFGCGGDRDRGKRPLMGAIAARLADRVWVTSDNPRSERPDAIVAEIVAGIPTAGAGRERHVTMPDRKAAIRAALEWARAGDVVVIAGKGHETYQIIGSEVLAFDDRAQARAMLAERFPGQRC